MVAFKFFCLVLVALLLTVKSADDAEAEYSPNFQKMNPTVV
jgi:hypothetical protein